MPRIRHAAAYLTAYALLTTPTFAQSVHVTDGDTIKFNGKIYRLWGIDAPESGQLCGDDWPAGRAATTYMRILIAGHTVEYETRGIDRYRRTIGLCKADGVDIQAEMVKAGMAWAFTRYSHDYVVQEGEAQAAMRGIHAHDCLPAWEWRAQQKN